MFAIGLALVPLFGMPPGLLDEAQARIAYTLSLDGPFESSRSRACVDSPGLLSGSGNGSVTALPDGRVVFSTGGLLHSRGEMWSSDLAGKTCRLMDRRFWVRDIAADSQGRVIVFADDDLLRVEPDGSVTRLHTIDPCEDSLPASGCAVGCQCYEDISVTAAGTILVALGSTRNRVVEVTPGRGQRTVAGTGSSGFSGDGGPATAARLNAPTGVAATPDGGFLIADTDNNRVRKVAPNGTITTAAGTGQLGLSGDGGPATAARLSVFKIAAGPGGGYALAGRSIRRVTRHGIIRTVAADKGPKHLNQGERTTDRLVGNGGSAREAFVGFSDLAITPDDDYLLAGYRLRVLAAPGTRRLAVAIRAVVGSRRRVSYALSRPAKLRLELRSGSRRWVWRRKGEPGLAHFRLPRRVPDGVYQFLLTASTANGQRAEREDAIVLGRRLDTRVARAATWLVYGLGPMLTPRGLNTRHTLSGSAFVRKPIRSRCHRFGRLRVDCRFNQAPVWGGGCDNRTGVNVRVQLDPGPGLFAGPYACGPFKRRARVFDGYRGRPLDLLVGAPWLAGRQGSQSLTDRPHQRETRPTSTGE